MAKKSQRPPQRRGDVLQLSGMYEDYFLDYASYVILERAVPNIIDGLKPVQRRILHALKEMDDGRYHKVANVIGQTMQFHPHGDAAIGDALVNLGQKDLLIDPQGNWGDYRTGDSAAASRYIEARLTKFALAVAFNPQITDWQMSYDGRKKEPIALPMKFPLLLTQGAEGIAVGLSTKILPHNFIELIKASIKILEGKKPKIYPDFPGGGLIDVSDYNQGKRGGRVKVRAKLEVVDKSTIAIRELPYGVTTTSMIDSIVKANDKGKIKIKKVVDNTARDVEILVDLAPGTSPDISLDALYAFTNCEVSISPNCCIIVDEKPHFITVNEMLYICTEQTKQLLKRELEIKQSELEEKWHFASLEKVFIQNRVYHEIEECETWEEVLRTIARELKKYVREPREKAKARDKRLVLKRKVTEEDITRLTEIRIKRISKYNSFKADELIIKLEEDLKQVRYDLKHLTDFSIAYFENLLEKFGKGRERKTKITTFDAIEVRQVVQNNAKLYVNRKDGFVGYGLKKDEFISECSDIDDIIAISKDGHFKVVRISDKVFVGKNLLHAAVWKKGDDRTTYNMIYVDGTTGRSMAKRFNVKSITRDKSYSLTKGAKGSKIHYLSVQPNGETEVVNVQLSMGSRARKKLFEFDFGSLDIKGRGAGGNIITKHPIRKVTFVEVGKSSLGSIQVWMDPVSGKLNTNERGNFLGEFDTGDDLLVLYKEGSYEVASMDTKRRFDVNEIVEVVKMRDDLVVNAVYFDGDKKWTLVKRFQVETNVKDKRFTFITEHAKSQLLFATTDASPIISYGERIKNKKEEWELEVADFIEIKGWKSLGNKLSTAKITGVKKIKQESEDKDSYEVGDSIEFDVNGQGNLFEEN
ncbi:MAG: DNA gyrase/topoisomerase IV subunit A [Saprospiraceae bacterium]|nr:DNA gyrase/topoisomerase IV subunit A [Saprospiraceae bacterium]